MNQTTTRRVRLGGLLYDYDDAKQDVEVERTLLHIAKAHRGKADGCMNSKACIDQRERFPHPVIAISTWKSRLFAIDKIYTKANAAGTAGHAIRYVLTARDGHDISSHDLLGVGRPATLLLRVPRGNRRAGSKKSTGPNAAQSKPKNPRSGDVNKGEKARLLAAVGAMVSK